MAFKKTFVVSDESVNCYGFVIKTAGIRLDQAKKNCPAYYNHQTWDIPLGHWENLRVEGTQLLADIVIEGANEAEKLYITKIQNGDIKGASGGFDPIVWNDDAKQLAQGQTMPTLQECDLFELSLAPLPGNKNALALKHQNSFITLSAINQNDIIPKITKPTNMKEIALKLGLPADATEAQIIAKLHEIQLTAATVNNYQKAIADVADGLDEISADVFVNLSKTEPEKAVKFLKSKQAEPIAETTGDTGETPVVLTTPAAKKTVSVASLIQKGKGTNGAAAPAEDDKECYDYLQKKNPAELSRLHKEDNAKYVELAKAYKGGKRYTGK